jgi:hypothetical protein
MDRKLELPSLQFDAVSLVSSELASSGPIHTKVWTVQTRFHSAG